jgi:26S proteasome regulatory subunit N1
MDIEGDETNGQDSSSSTTTTNGTHGSGGDQKEKEKVKDESHMAVAVLGVALIAMGEEIGYEMSLRMFQHVFRYGELHVRRSVPLAIALMHVSNPVSEVMDALGKLTHDED